MGYRKLLITIMVAFGVLGLSFGIGHAKAQSFQTGTDLHIAKDQSVDSSVYLAGRTIDIAGNVNGDVFCAGQNIVISGVINGDVICAGQTVNVTGVIHGNARIAGQSITLTGAIDRNLTVAGQSVTTGANNNIAGDTTIAASTMTLNGSIGRDAVLDGQAVTVDGSIGRDARSDVANLYFGSNARVKGEVRYTSQNKANLAPGALISGQLIHSVPTSKHTGSRWTVLPFGFIGLIYMSVSALLIALVLVLLFPRQIHQSSQNTQKHVGKTILVGLIAGAVVPIMSVVIMFTVFGIPLAMVLLLVWLLLTILAGPVAGYYLGHLIFPKLKNPIYIMLVGVELLVLLSLVPFLGFIVFLLAYWLGTGTILMAMKHTFTSPKYTIE